ncbi:zinc finger protein 277 isoform X2 [Brienomyrus brachyistius]|uniref:zinc finger protein 277 isoform X2 n=1 Tax=Brienomyrus brachyistius TaxID=42636 RepID=UPI0020B25B45|nr:zinc finger protein 277 isoform X2 [Brienomyrus brachyistius]
MAACSDGKAMRGQDCILEPLSFPEGPGSGAPIAGVTAATIPCALCPDPPPLWEKEQLLKHMLLEHKLVIADVRLVADFPRYILYWRRRFSELPITDFCSVIQTNSHGPAEKQERYFLLCDALPEDRVLREQLQQERLEQILEQQQRERDDHTFQRTCMFCPEQFTGNRALLLNHMAKEHGFNVGLPDNVVHCDEFLDTLQAKLDRARMEEALKNTTLVFPLRPVGGLSPIQIPSPVPCSILAPVLQGSPYCLRCLYCERTFRDKNTLKDHMRKKLHRKINSNNKEYDRFYVINYLELGKTWEEVQSEDDREMMEDRDDDWSDWQARPLYAVCLFCEHQSETMDQIYTHMQDSHGFDLHKLKAEFNLKFYQQVKLVNFIRREVHQCRCYGCQKKFDSREAVVQHMRDAAHAMTLPPQSTWDQPQYYFPTYENDGLLCALSDSDGESDPASWSADVPVISEDVPTLEALGQNSVLGHLLEDRDSPPMGPGAV